MEKQLETPIICSVQSLLVLQQFVKFFWQNFYETEIVMTVKISSKMSFYNISVESEPFSWPQAEVEWVMKLEMLTERKQSKRF